MFRSAARSKPMIRRSVAARLSAGPVLVAMFVTLGPSVTAQPAAGASVSGPDSVIVVRPRWSPDRFVANRSALEFELSRGLAPSERLAVVVGATDISAALEVVGTVARYRPVGWRLPAGESEVTVYLVRADGTWVESGRAPLKVLNRLGLERARVLPSVDLSSAGQVDQRIDPTAPPPRRTFQDLTLRIGLENTLARDGWAVSAQGNAVGVSLETQRLRWGERAMAAPAVDLADYRIEVARGGARVAMGNVTAGSHRLLLNGFGSRGLSAGVAFGPSVALEAAVVNGSSVVGWSNLVGLADADHQIAVGTLRFELAPKRPGGLRFGVTGLDGSVRPTTGYTQGAATDAEQSRGVGVELAASDARDRVRFSGGIARSRFVNPGDPLLFGDTAIVAVRPATRTARFGELGLRLLDGWRLGGGTPVSLGATARHERVDPLFRSVAGSVQSDVRQDALDVTGAVGALSWQASFSSGRDNLDRIASILTSRTRTRSLNASLPLAALLGVAAAPWYLPALTYSWQRTRQWGEGLPANGDFSASHVPDQWSTSQSGSATWSAVRWNLAYRWNQSFQDNRQPGREAADFRGIVHAVSLALTGFPGFSPSLDASVERQKSFESARTQRTERLGVSIQAQVFRATALSGSVSQAWGFDPFADQRTRNTEFQVELSQGLDLYRRIEGGNQARFYLRYARTRAAFLPLVPTPGLVTQVLWTLNAGASIRLY